MPYSHHQRKKRLLRFLPNDCFDSVAVEMALLVHIYRRQKGPEDCPGNRIRIHASSRFCRVALESRICDGHLDEYEPLVKMILQSAPSR